VPYVVYDMETSGLNTVFGQIFQFAVIVAYADLRGIGCRRLRPAVPSPRVAP
jgi:hypothetical protein